MVAQVAVFGLHAEPHALRNLAAGSVWVCVF